jgi:hypothetical protein
MAKRMYLLHIYEGYVQRLPSNCAKILPIDGGNSIQTVNNIHSYIGLTGRRVSEKTRDRQCTYNVTLRRVHATIVAVKKQ